MTNVTDAALEEYSDQKRLEIYKLITSACTHLYSKGKLQEAKFKDAAKTFADLAIHDPIFMAHFTAWSAKQDSKDMKVLTIFFNALNDANGTPFFKGSKKNKPNFREASYALLQTLDPHLALRVLELCHKRFDVDGILNNSRHFPTGMKTAFRKYLHYREGHADMLRGIKKSGLSKKFQQIYRLTRTAPTDESAEILNWKQKDGRELDMESLPDYSNMTALEIAEDLTNTRLSPMVAMSVIPKNKMTSRVAKALLQNCTGNQSIILYNWFARNGFLDVKAIKALFADKVKEATTAVDRIDTLTKDADASDKKEMAAARSTRRKKVTRDADIGKIYLHIDASGSMQRAIEFARETAALFAECVNDPSENFRWGMFGTRARELEVPEEFTKEDFHAALYGMRANMGQTDCVALYPHARKFGADVDVYITDQGHNIGTIHKRIKEFHEKYEDVPKPRAAVIVDFGGGMRTTLEDSLRKVEIPVAIIKPEAMKESALVAQSIKAALVGELAVIDEILDTPLPRLPRWWRSVSSKAKVETVAVEEAELAEMA